MVKEKLIEKKIESIKDEKKKKAIQEKIMLYVNHKVWSREFPKGMHDLDSELETMNKEWKLYWKLIKG